MPTTLNTPEKPEGEFRLTGRHVLYILVGAFAIVFAVNGYMIWRAVGSFPGVVTESSFRDSQRYNAEVAAAKAQADRGWRVEVKTDRASDGKTLISLQARDREGQPLTGVTFRALLEHPADRSRDHKIALSPVVGTSDRFEGRAEGVTAGKWGLLIEGDGTAGRLYLSQNSIYFE